MRQQSASTKKVAGHEKCAYGFDIPVEQNDLLCAATHTHAPGTGLGYGGPAGDDGAKKGGVAGGLCGGDVSTRSWAAALACRQCDNLPGSASDDSVDGSVEMYRRAPCRS